jgi:large subunit ribosomal protein L4
MNLNYLDQKKTHEFSVSNDIFATDFNEGLVHQVIVSMQSNLRTGNSSQLTRSEVRGGGAKPWRQKGTGRARAGTSRSPIWRKGGVTFASSNPNFSQKINKKVYRKSVSILISEHIRRNSFYVFDNFIKTNKTSEMISFLKNNSLNGKVLFVIPAFNENMFLSVRNIPNVDIVTVSELNPLMLAHFKSICVSKDSLEILEGNLSK